MSERDITMPKAFLVKNNRKGGVPTKSEVEEPVLDQQVPYFYHPLYYPPTDYCNTYIPSIWPRHYPDINSWNNYHEKPNNFANSSAIPGLNLPQPLNLGPQIAAPFSHNPFSLNNQPINQQQANVANLFQNHHVQSDQSFQISQFIHQQQHQNFVQQQDQYVNEQEKGKRDLYNEIFDLDSNASKKSHHMLLPNTIANLGNIKQEMMDNDDVLSTDSSNACSESSSNAVVDNIINSAISPTMVKNEQMKNFPPKNLNDLSPKNEDGGDKIYQCEFCNKNFTRSWNYQRHVLIHSGRKPHKCEICPKAFVLAAHLKIHMRIHTGEKPYKCTVCGRGFAQLTNLQRHVLTHTGQKPHRCQHCNKGFVSSSDLRRHIRIHTGEKPYQCQACSKAFTTSGNLQSHVLTHTGVKPYSCSTCKWKFISSSNLRTHIRTHHCNEDNQMVPENLGVPTPLGQEERVYLPSVVKSG
nr:zinc finger protein 16-like [Hydra vulgaris]